MDSYIQTRKVRCMAQRMGVRMELRVQEIIFGEQNDTHTYIYILYICIYIYILNKVLKFKSTSYSGIRIAGLTYTSTLDQAGWTNNHKITIECLHRVNSHSSCWPNAKRGPKPWFPIAFPRPSQHLCSTKNMEMYGNVCNSSWNLSHRTSFYQKESKYLR